MKRSILSLLVVLTVLAFGVTNADAQIRIPRRPGVSATPVTPPPPAGETTKVPPPEGQKPADTPPPSTGVQIVTDTLPAIQANRDIRLDDLAIKVTGIDIDGVNGWLYYEDGTDEALNPGDGSLSPTKPGDYKLIVGVHKKGAKDILATKEFTLHVVPFVRTLDDIAKAIASRDYSDSLARQLKTSEDTVAQLRKTNFELGGRLENALQANEALQKANRERWASWQLSFSGAVLGSLLTILVVWLFSRRKRRASESKVLKTLGYTGGVLVAALVLGGANIAGAQAPPTPAKPTVTITSVSPTDVGLGQETVVLTVNLNKTVKDVDQPAQINGLTVEKTEISKNGKTITITAKPNATATTGSQVVLYLDGQTIESGDKLGVILWTPESYELLTRIAKSSGQLRAEVSQAVAPANHAMQAVFQHMLGDKDGNTAWVAYRAKPTHAAVEALLQQADARLATGINVMLVGDDKQSGALAPIAQAAANANSKATQALAVANAAADGTTTLGKELVGTTETVAGLHDVKAKPGFFKGAKPVLSADKADEEQARMARIQATIETLIAARRKVGPKDDQR